MSDKPKRWKISNSGPTEVAIVDAAFGGRGVIFAFIAEGGHGTWTEHRQLANEIVDWLNEREASKQPEPTAA